VYQQERNPSDKIPVTMSASRDFFFSDPFQRNRIIILASVVIVTVSLNIFGLFEGLTVVLPHLLYIPLVLAGYWFPRRGILFSLLIAAVYGAAAITLSPYDPVFIVMTAARCLILVIIGSTVSILSLKLVESERQLHTIIEFLPDATFAIDREGKVIAWNRAIEELTGTRKSDILGKGDYEYSLPFYHERRPVLIDAILTGKIPEESGYPGTKLENGQMTTDIFIPHLRNGRGAHLRLNATRLTDASGAATGAIESVREITDQVMTASALQKAGSRLNIIGSIVRNDITKRLAVLYGHLTIGVMKFDDPDVIAFIGSVKDSADAIQRQVEISRVFRDLGTSTPAWVPVQTAVMEAAGRITLRRPSLRVWTERLEIFSDPNLPTAFYQLFENIRREGPEATKIIVTYHIRDRGCAILIEDDGGGVPDAEKETLFRKRNERYGCSLFLAGEILGITGMNIRETGVHGKGTRFEILIPPEGYRVR
jgi:PAS domain S-box-containing protein